MPEVAERGVDTWRVVRYLETDAEVDQARGLMPQGRLAEKAADHVVGFLPGHQMVWAEGHPGGSGLAPTDALEDAYAGLLAALQAADVPLGRDAGVARLDATVGVRLPRAADTPVILAGMGAVDVPRCKPVVYGRPPQTVAWQGARSRAIFARAYDKHLEQGVVAPTGLLRFEAQGRYVKEKRRAVANLAPADDFQKRFQAMAKSATGVRAMSYPVLQREIAERLNGGEITHLQAERVLGYLGVKQAGGQRYPARTAERRRAELRELGLVLADDFFEPVSVDLGEVFDAAVSAW